MNRGREHEADRLARGLGWGSLGLGVIQLAAPDAVRRLCGVDDSSVARVMVPLAGVRELFHAAVLLGSRKPAPWVWTRMAGDAMYLTTLGCAAANRRGARRRRAAIATAAVVGITAADLYTALRHERRPWSHGMTLRAAITVRRPREEIYRFWRDLTNLPRFMVHLESVQVTDERYSHWIAKGPGRRTIEWDAEIIEDRPGEIIAWRSDETARVRDGGAVRFADAPGGRGTEVRVELRYDRPGGMAGAAFARLMGEHPEQQVRDDLRRFKQVMEVGEVTRSEGSPEGVRAMRPAKQRPAQPVATGGTR